jgi:hypothetical protein
VTATAWLWAAAALLVSSVACLLFALWTVLP